MVEQLRLKTRDGVELVADAYGSSGARGVLLAHGGGQTRHAWGSTARELAERGWRAVSIDLRGHGDSGWSPDGTYGLERFADDLLLAAETFGEAPALVGASLGGLAGLTAQGELVPAERRRGFSALVLVDVTPRVEQSGIDRIRGFMSKHLDDGFATLEEAAAVIAAYLPHRPPPRSLEGLRKNLRQGKDGRYRWHWDPRFVTQRPLGDFATQQSPRLQRSAAAIRIPTLLVRGGRSEVVTDESVREFLALVPHARQVDIRSAGHMVAGDANDSFSDAVIAFLDDAREAIAR